MDATAVDIFAQYHVALQNLCTHWMAGLFTSVLLTLSLPVLDDGKGNCLRTYTSPEVGGHKAGEQEMFACVLEPCC